tara:strand:- start:9453 stop:9641 length:189 start_codon:yes stop_codon:yes gene_type:complete
MTVYSETLKHVGRTKMREKQVLPLAGTYANEQPDGNGSAHVVNESIIDPAGVTEDICAEFAK